MQKYKIDIHYSDNGVASSEKVVTLLCQPTFECSQKNDGLVYTTWGTDTSYQFYAHHDTKEYITISGKLPRNQYNAFKEMVDAYYIRLTFPSNVVLPFPNVTEYKAAIESITFSWNTKGTFFAPEIKFLIS